MPHTDQNTHWQDQWFKNLRKKTPWTWTPLEVHTRWPQFRSCKCLTRIYISINILYVNCHGWCNGSTPTQGGRPGPDSLPCSQFSYDWALCFLALWDFIRKKMNLYVYFIYMEWKEEVVPFNQYNFSFISPKNLIIRIEKRKLKMRLAQTI